MKLSFLPLALAVISLSGTSAHAMSLLLDFGSGAPTGTPAAGSTDAQKTAGYAAHAGESYFNYGGESPTLTGLVYGDGTTAAIGVTVTIAAEATTGSNTINFASGPALNYGSLAGTAVTVPNSALAGNSPMRDGVFKNGTANTNNAAMGASISGLAAGTYTLYVSGRNTNNGSADTPANFYLSVANTLTPTSFQFSGAGNITQATANATHTIASLNGTSYTNGVTHVEFTVTIAAGDSILLATEGTSSTEMRGFLNSIEIVSVPEPSVAGLALLGVMLAGRRRRA